jgi:hypothetical protein
MSSGKKIPRGEAIVDRLYQEKGTKQLISGSLGDRRVREIRCTK